MKDISLSQRFGHVVRLYFLMEGLDWLIICSRAKISTLFLRRWLRANFVQGWLNVRYCVADLGQISIKGVGASSAAWIMNLDINLWHEYRRNSQEKWNFLKEIMYVCSNSCWWDLSTPTTGFSKNYPQDFSTYLGLFYKNNTFYQLTPYISLSLLIPGTLQLQIAAWSLIKQKVEWLILGLPKALRKPLSLIA